MKLVKMLISVAAVAALVSGCGSSTDGTAVGESATDGTDQSAQRYLGKTVWYDGFEITVGQVTAERLQDSQVEIGIEVSYKNLIGAAHKPGQDPNGNETGRTGHLEWGSESTDLEFDLPKVAPNAVAQGTVKREITAPEEGTLEDLLDSMTLVYGESGTNQTKVPFLVSGAVESEEPRGITVGQTLGSDPSLQLVSAYLWPSYAEGEAGQYELWIEYEFECAGPCGEIFYGPDSWTLTTPGGQTKKMDSRSPTVYEVPGPDDTRGTNFVIFLLDDETSGSFSVNVKGSQDDTITFDETTELQLG